MLAPLAAPTELPPLPPAAAEAAGEGSTGLGFSADQLRQLAAEAYAGTLHPQLLPAAAAKQGLGGWGAAGGSAGGSLSASFSEDEQGTGRLLDRLVVPAGTNGGVVTVDGSGSGGSATTAAGSAAASRSWDAELSAEIAAGEGPVLAALGSYFRHLETTGSSDGGGQEEQAALAEAIAAFDAPATPCGCFPALFGRRGFCFY